MLDYSVLVLNASYEAINICNLRRAITMIFKGIACAEEETEHEIMSASMIIRVPTVIRLLRYIRIPHRNVRFSRKNVLLRDSFRCQYCGEIFSPSQLTLDHVKPLSHGGKTQWDNIVTACKTCNIKKANKTPSEAGMELLRVPKAPPVVYYLHLIKNTNGHHVSWQKYLFPRDQ
jgi:5-methylcytosine-specific restriction endonuclease McrA